MVRLVNQPMEPECMKDGHIDVEPSCRSPNPTDLCSHPCPYPNRSPADGLRRETPSTMLFSPSDHLQFKRPLKSLHKCTKESARSRSGIEIRPLPMRNTVQRPTSWDPRYTLTLLCSIHIPSSPCRPCHLAAVVGPGVLEAALLLHSTRFPSEDSVLPDS
jgi:hypothetical protein